MIKYGRPGEGLAICCIMLYNIILLVYNGQSGRVDVVSYILLAFGLRGYRRDCIVYYIFQKIQAGSRQRADSQRKAVQRAVLKSRYADILRRMGGPDYRTTVDVNFC